MREVDTVSDNYLKKGDGEVRGSSYSYGYAYAAMPMPTVTHGHGMASYRIIAIGGGRGVRETRGKGSGGDAGVRGEGVCSRSYAVSDPAVQDGRTRRCAS